VPEARARAAQRDTYRHGDLRRALVEAGIQLARDGGPDAVVLREATRRVGVAPNAAYRHFADHRALLGAVCSAAQSALAIAMERELARLSPGQDPAENARDRLRACGVVYLRFAQEEPGLFRAAFSVPGSMELAHHPSLTGNSRRTPFQLLNAALDELVNAGALTPERRQGAEFLTWSAVHGLASLLIDGPLRGLERPATAEIEQRLFDMIQHGL
jgi:AcrR family transcriptional regulator